MAGSESSMRGLRLHEKKLSQCKTRNFSSRKGSAVRMAETVP